MEKGLFILFSMAVVIIVLMLIAGNYSVYVMNTMAVLIVLGLIAGGLIPSILVTWMIIGLTTIGSAILLLGYIVMGTPLKLLLLVTFPLTASMATGARYLLGEFRWINHNRNAVESYYTHYDQVVKLQTEYNAQKRYQKERTFVEDSQMDLWLDITAIHWEHHEQIQQFHPREYQKQLQVIASVLKHRRLPSEAIYYLGNATFLIISHRLSQAANRYLNDLTSKDLGKIKIGNTSIQYKWGEQRISKDNVGNYQELTDVLRHIERDMETDIVVEYLKGSRSV